VSLHIEGLEATYPVHLRLNIGNLLVDLLLVIPEMFCQMLQMRCCKWMSIRNWRCWRGWVTLEQHFR